MGMLKKVAMRFNNTPCHSVSTGVFLFNCQLDVFNDITRDGITTSRRVIEVKPNTTIPQEGAIRVGHLEYVLSKYHEDFCPRTGEVLREKYVGHEVYGPSNVLTGLEILRADEADLQDWPVKFWAGKTILRHIRDQDQDAYEAERLMFYFNAGASSSTVRAGRFLIHGGSLHLIRDAYLGNSGYLEVIAEEITVPQVTSGGTFAADFPILGKGTPSNPNGAPKGVVKGIPVRWQTDYIYFSQVSPDFKRGDMQLVVEATGSPQVGDKLQEGDVFWVVQNTMPSAYGESDGTVRLHCRRIP